MSEPLESEGLRLPCNAPFVTMSLQTDGRVFACCRKPAVLLGKVTETSLADIWHGPRALALRESMRSGRTDPACAHCMRLVERGVGRAADLQKYAHLKVDDPHPAWPRRLEFNLANTCNLECIHCSGALSSRIRARRELLPPLPRVYGDAFFAELEEFLPHLESAVFLGGEPFLQRECRRIWSMLLEGGHAPQCLIVTNGTVCDDFTQRVLEGLPCRLTVSLDGATRETVESVRVGASFDRIVENLSTFRRLTKCPGSALLLAICAMRSNWQELGRFCLWADSLDAQVRINPLSDPPELSLLSLDEDELRGVVAELRAEARHVEPRLGRNRAVYRGWIDALGEHLETGAGPAFRSALRESRDRLAALELEDRLTDLGAQGPMLALEMVLGELPGAAWDEASRALGDGAGPSVDRDRLLQIHGRPRWEPGAVEDAADLLHEQFGDGVLAGVLGAALADRGEDRPGWPVYRLAVRLLERGAWRAGEAALRCAKDRARDGAQMLAGILMVERLAPWHPRQAFDLLESVDRAGEMHRDAERRFHAERGRAALSLGHRAVAADVRSAFDALGFGNDFQRDVYRELGGLLEAVDGEVG